MLRGMFHESNSEGTKQFPARLKFLEHACTAFYRQNTRCRSQDIPDVLDIGLREYALCRCASRNLGSTFQPSPVFLQSPDPLLLLRCPPHESLRRNCHGASPPPFAPVAVAVSRKIEQGGLFLLFLLSTSSRHCLEHSPRNLAPAF